MEFNDLEKALNDALEYCKVLKEQLGKDTDATICPKCGCDSAVVGSRYSKKYDCKVRIRKCLECGNNWQTEEIMVKG